MTLAERRFCCGCAACHAVCARNAIQMEVDKEGFLYPRIDEAKCVDCGKCAAVCPVLNKAIKRTPLSAYAVNAKDDKVREESSSGGVFTLLATNVLKDGGVVFGAAFDSSNWQVRHIMVDNIHGLSELQGSKYVQSDVSKSYVAVAEALKAGRRVLFTGTPCQIAAIRMYLGIARIGMSGLLLVDVACHAVPSPLAWRKYLEKRVSEAYVGEISEVTLIRRIFSRRKNCGWKKFAASVSFDNDAAYLRTFGEDSFMRAFLAELCNRSSCHNCSFRESRSGSDITIADYWGVATKFPEMDDDKGTSLVLLNTSKGLSAWESVAGETIHRQTDYAHACKYNSALFRSKAPHSKRYRFFRNLNTADFDSLVDKCLVKPLAVRVRLCVACMLRKVGIKR